VRDSRGKIKFEKDETILEILFADTHSKPGVESSDDEDYFGEQLRAQKIFWDSGVAITNTGQQNHVSNCTAICVVLLAREREECISALDVRWECVWCIVSQNITLK
jgi:hypothetical protein